MVMAATGSAHQSPNAVLSPMPARTVSNSHQQAVVSRQVHLLGLAIVDEQPLDRIGVVIDEGKSRSLRIPGEQGVQDVAMR